MSEMRILTVQPPWAQAIMFGGKTVENRSRNLAGNWRGMVAIHSGKRFDDSSWDHRVMGALLDDWLRRREEIEFMPGAIIGVVDLVEVHCGSISERWDALEEHNAQCSPWAEPDAWHLTLANPRPLSAPILYRGALGLRRLPDDVAEQVIGAAEPSPIVHQRPVRGVVGQDDPIPRVEHINVLGGGIRAGGSQ